MIEMIRRHTIRNIIKSRSDAMTFNRYQIRDYKDRLLTSFRTLSEALAERDRCSEIVGIWDVEGQRWEGRVPQAPKAAPNGPQKYLGAQNHTWEDVIPSEDATDRDDVTDRLRVPGGWLYRNGPRMVFVPMPEAVGYEV